MERKELQEDASGEAKERRDGEKRWGEWRPRARNETEGDVSKLKVERTGGCFTPTVEYTIII